MIRFAAAAAAEGDRALQDAIETLPAPIYLTDADGWVTFFNRACVDFAGRTPVAGQDRWCVTWRLYTEKGAPLPHDCAVNLLIDVTDERQSASLKAQAQRCRRLAQSVTDSRTVSTLLGMATEYEDKARALQPRETH